jgi:hypothetical protein
MATTGIRTPSAKEPREDQAGVSATVGGSQPADGRDTGATTATTDTAGAGGAQVARGGAFQQRGKTQRAALLEQAEEAAAKLKGLMAELAGTWVSPLAETEPRVVALAARLVPAAECLETVRESLASTAAQPESAREQMLQAEAHLGFAQLHMAAAQKFQTPADEKVAPSDAPSIPAGAQLVRALTEARGFEAAASAPQASWTREALRRTACVSYVALEACEVAVRTSWNPRECSTYHDLLDREEQRLDETFGGMSPDELPGAVVAVAEVWLDDAYDNITLAQACLAGRSQHEEEQIAALGEHPEPPNGETSAEKARRLWILRAFQQTSCVSHMAQEIGDDSTKTGWSIWSYKEYRRLLDKEMKEVCRIYAEVELADLPVSKGKEAKEWLTSTHQEAERARAHRRAHQRHEGAPGAPLPCYRRLVPPLPAKESQRHGAPQGKGSRCKTRRTSRGGSGPGPAASSQGNWDAGEISAGGRSGHWVRRDGKRPAKKLCLPAYT